LGIPPGPGSGGSSAPAADRPRGRPDRAMAARCAATPVRGASDPALGNRAAPTLRPDPRQRSAAARRPGASTAWPGPADRAAPVRPRAGGYAAWRGFSLLGALPRHAEDARQVSLNSLAIARGGRTAGRAMVAADRDQPVLSRRVLFAQNRRGDG